jgi:hypothetical protein
MRHINRLEFDLDEAREHIIFLEALLKTLHGEEWNTLTISKAKTLSTISEMELRKLTMNSNKPLKDFSDITPAHMRMVHDIIEVIGADPSQKAKDLLLEIQSKVAIRTVVVVPRGGD